MNGKNTYALEGSIFIAGAGVQWLRDKLKFINNAFDTERIAQSKKIMRVYTLCLLSVEWEHLIGGLMQEG